MGKSIRNTFKEHIPESYWPIFKFIDSYLIDLLYINYLFRRLLHNHRCGGFPQRDTLDIFTFNTAPDIFPGTGPVQILQKLGINFSEGRHSIYLSDPKAIERICPSITGIYPQPFGLKIIKSQQISSDGTPYYTSSRLAAASNAITMRAVGSVLEKVAISNLLNMYNVAPRVFDLVRIKSRQDAYWALVVQPVEGKMVTGERGVIFVKKLTEVLRKAGIKTLGISNHKDFRPPDFRNNIISDKNGTYYVDIQNFVFFDCQHRRHLLQKIEHLEEKHRTPAVSNSDDVTAAEKRKNRRKQSDRYWKELDIFLAENRVSFEKAYVLNIGCRSGDLITHALRRMSSWCVGICDEQKALFLTEWLYYQGHTRFDLMPISNTENLRKHTLTGRAFDMVFYRGQGNESGFPPWLQKINFKYFVYRGFADEKIVSISDRIKSTLGFQALDLRKLYSSRFDSSPTILCSR